MRVVVCGDCHIGAIFGLGNSNGKGGNTRVDDYEKSLNYIVDYTIDTGADVFVQTGDIFEHRNPSPEHINVADRALKRLSEAGVVTAVIMGNHDYKKTGEGFTSSILSLSAKDYPNVRLIIEPEIMSVTSSDGDKTNIVLLPYRDRRMYPGENNREQSEGYDDHVKGLISSLNKDSTTIAIGHNFFYEGSYNDYGGSELLASPKAFEGCDIVMMGHLHQFRIVRKRTPVCVYVGSMEKSNFGDSDIDKYFVDYDIEQKKPKICKIPVRDLIDTAIDLTDEDFSSFEPRLSKEIDELNLDDKVVRVKILAKESLIPALDRAKITKELYSGGAFFVSKVIVEAVAAKVVRDISILKHKDDYSMFEAFINSQLIDDDMKSLVLEQAKGIMV